MIYVITFNINDKLENFRNFPDWQLNKCIWIFYALSKWVDTLIDLFCKLANKSILFNILLAKYINYHTSCLYNIMSNLKMNK